MGPSPAPASSNGANRFPVRRFPARRAPEALQTQVTLERDVPLQQCNRVAELAPHEVRPAQNGRGDHLDRAIAEGARDAEGLPPESDGLVVVARGQALDHREGGDPPEPGLVAERPGGASPSAAGTRPAA